MSEPGLELSKLVFGTMGYGDIDAKDRIRTIHCAIDHGLTSLDTAPLYGFGEVERVLGRAIRDRRARVQILGKCGLRWDSDYGEPLFPADVDGQRRWIRRDSRPAAVRRDVEESLTRLGVEAIDLMQVHEHDRLTALEDTLECLVKLRDEGKIRAIGVSNFSPEALRSAVGHRGARLFSTQNMFNLLDQDSSADIRRDAQQCGLSLLCYSPFAQGALAGKLLNSKVTVDDWRRDSPAFHAANVHRMNAVLIRSGIPIAEGYDITLPQLVLEATLSRAGVTNVIVGARTPEQIASNAGALHGRVPAAALDEFAAALHGCGWSSHAGEPVSVRMRRLARRIRQVCRLGSRSQH